MRGSKGGCGGWPGLKMATLHRPHVQSIISRGSMGVRLTGGSTPSPTPLPAPRDLATLLPVSSERERIQYSHNHVGGNSCFCGRISIIWKQITCSADKSLGSRASNTLLKHWWFPILTWCNGFWPIPNWTLLLYSIDELGRALSAEASHNQNTRGKWGKA